MRIRFIIFIISVIPAFIIFGCEESGTSVTNFQTISLKRVYILYTGSTGAADYAVYDAEANTVTDEVYRNSNSGKTLNTNAADMKLNNNRDLFITAAGTFSSGEGSIYRINTSDNKAGDSLRVSWNPYGFVINNNNIIVSNLSGSVVSKFDLDFNLLTDSISVGEGPTTIIYGMAQYVVSKMSTTPEKSLAFISEANSTVTKLFFQTTPVSSVFNINGFFVSTYNSKRIYRIDSETLEKIDSFTVPTSLPAITDLIHKEQRKFFVIASNKEIWEAEITVNGIVFRNIFPAQADVNILNAAYESTKNEIYIAHGSDPFSNGRMIIINAETGLVKRSLSLGGKSPVRFSFMY